MMNDRIHEILFKIIRAYDLYLDYACNSIKDIEYYILRKDDNGSISVQVTSKCVYITIDSNAKTFCDIQVSDEIKIDYILKKQSVA